MDKYIGEFNIDTRNFFMLCSGEVKYVKEFLRTHENINVNSRYLFDEKEFQLFHIAGDICLHHTTNYDVFKFLLDEGADPNSQNSLGVTPMMKSVNECILKLLLSRGANPFIKDKTGQTAMAYFSSKRMYRHLLFLLERGFCEENAEDIYLSRVDKKSSYYTSILDAIRKNMSNIKPAKRE